MKKIKVSVIIPSYNEEKNIEECLKTILDQSYSEIEVIVVDDGSSDKTPEIVKKYPVKLLTQAHLGPAKARNFGVSNTTGEILVLLDADMSFSHEFVEDLVEPIISGQYKGTFSKEEYISNWENVWSRCWNFNYGWPKQKMIPDDYPDEGKDFRAILKSEFLRVNGFDDIGYTDTWSLSRKLGYKPHSVKRAVYYHKNPDNLGEIFIQARWVAKRDYKFGIAGKFVALVRSFILMSILIGLVKSIRYKEPSFMIFKVIYDLGIFVGVLELIMGGKLSK